MRQVSSENLSLGLLNPEEKAQLKRRQRGGKLLYSLSLIPVILAVGLIGILLTTVFLDSFSWQVIELNNSGKAFKSSEANTWSAVIKADLAAQGQSQSEIEALFADKVELDKFAARNRVERVWLPKSIYGDEGGWRFILRNSRDKQVENLGLFEGRAELPRLASSLKDGQLLILHPWLNISFLNRNNSGKAWLAGLLTALVGSLWVIGLVIIISLPIGVGTAIYLEEYAAKNWFSQFIEVNLRNLAGVPSIVYGILGLYAFVRFLSFGPSILSAALTLSLLILPVIVIASREAIRSVPDSLRQASYGLGATKWQTVASVVLPNAVTGIVTGVILAVARALGETAPLLLVGGAGFVSQMPKNPLSSYSVLPTQIYSWIGAPDPSFDHVAAAGILVMMMLLIALYVVAFFIRRRFERKW
ncbi:MAG: phosphate ABC transporter permease PstA [Deinococcales bacterium]